MDDKSKQIGAEAPGKLIRLTGPQLLALYDLKGTGRYVGKDARMRARVMPRNDYSLRTLLSLRSKGLIDHWIGSEWYLTADGQDWIHKGKL